MSAPTMIQSPGRQFVQSPARQRNSEIAAGDMLARMIVTGFAITGGFPTFDGSSNSSWYQYCLVETTGTIWDGSDGDGNPIYSTHTEREESWVHPLYNDVYKWQRTADGVLKERWLVPEDWAGNPNDAPGYELVDNSPGGLPNANFIHFTDELVNGPAFFTFKRTSLDDPNIYRLIVGTLGERVNKATVRDATTMMDGLDFTCNQSFQVWIKSATGWGEYTRKTGLVDPALLPNVIRGMIRFSGHLPGVRNYASAPVFGGDVGGEGTNPGYYGLCGSYHFEGGIGLAAPLPDVQTSTYGLPLAAGANYWFASKLKIVKGKSEVEIARYNSNDPLVLGPPEYQYTRLTGSPACEPCYTAAPADRCRFEGYYRPRDTWIPGFLSVDSPPLTVAGGNLFYDLNGDGVFSEDDVPFDADGNPIFLDGAPIRVTIPGHTYDTFTGYGGWWGVRLPDIYSGPVTKQILTDDPRFLERFMRLNNIIRTHYTEFRQTHGTNPDGKIAGPRLFGDFGTDGFQPLPP